MTHNDRPPPTALMFLAVATLPAAAAPAAAAPYLFTEVAQTEAYPEVMPLGQGPSAGPALNGAGAVAFRQISGGVDGLFVRGPDGTVAPVATSADGAFRAFGRAPDLNDAGAVVFHAFGAAGGEGLYVAAPGAPLATVADTAGGTIRRFTSWYAGAGSPAMPAINNAGVVACVVDRTSDTINSASVLRYENGVAAFPAVGPIAGGADVNGRGEVVFVTGVNTVRAADATGARVVAEPSPGSPQGELVRGATSNDSGLYLTGSAFGPNILLIRDGAVTPFRSGPNMNHYGGFSLNEAGDVAYITARATEIYAGDPAAPQRLIGEGDALFGSTVTDLAYSREGFNDAGQVAFWAALADGRNVIALAIPVPEPAAAGLLLAAAGLALRRRRASPEER